MKTSTFKLDLMQPGGAANKDLVYNENLLKIDCLMNSTVNDFIKELPNNAKAGDKYIVTTGEHKDKICYKSHQNKPLAFLPAYLGQVVFVQSVRSFFTYDGEAWGPVELMNQSSSSNASSSSSSSSSSTNIISNTLLTGDEKFTGIEGEYYAPIDHEFLYLYISNDVQVNLNNVKTRVVTFIIKQHYQDIKQFNWPENILWQNKAPHQLTAKVNATDIVRIYRLVETNHFLGEVVGQNYQF